MSFRRIPFQFSATDPVERQRELERRFGLPTNQNMYIDMNNPLSTGTIPKETSSPRLQHRIPIFADGYDQPMNSSVDSRCSNPDNKKPNVRVIPIEIEGADSKPSARHRTFSGPAGNVRNQRETPIPVVRDDSSIKNSMEDLSKPTKVTSSEPRVFNIPIQIEGANSTQSPKPKREKREVTRANGCHVSKSTDKVKSPQKEKTQEKKEPAVSPEQEVLKKIEKVLEEFTSYEKDVQEFKGTVKEKQYRYLDEMLTRCMLRLDELDTMGNEELRVARKNAVRKIQASIDLLESKANSTTNEVKTEDGVTSKADNDGQDVEMKEQKDVVQENDTDAEKEQLTDTAEIKDVEMKENSEASEAAQDGKEVASHVQKTDSPAVNLEKESQSAMNDVDMSGKESIDNPVESVCSDSQISENIDKNQTNKVVVNSENSSAASTEEVQLNKCPSGTEETELPEVEMDEVKTASPVKEPVTEINEIEMVDSNLTDVPNPKSDEIIETSESSSQDSPNAVIDVEMNDLPLDVVKDVPEKTEESSPSMQSVEQKENKTVVEGKSAIVDAKNCVSDTENEQKTANSCSNAGDTNKS